MIVLIFNLRILDDNRAKDIIQWIHYMNHIIK
jgi:hypothetical protein